MPRLSRAEAKMVIEALSSIDQAQASVPAQAQALCALASRLSLRLSQSESKCGRSKQKEKTHRGTERSPQIETVPAFKEIQ